MGNLSRKAKLINARKTEQQREMFPDDPNEALNQLQTLEKTLFNSDPCSAQRKIMQEALHSKDLLP